MTDHPFTTVQLLLVFLAVTLVGIPIADLFRGAPSPVEVSVEKTITTDDFDVLNAPLTDHGLPPDFRPFGRVRDILQVTYTEGGDLGGRGVILYTLDVGESITTSTSTGAVITIDRPADVVHLQVELIGSERIKLAGEDVETVRGSNELTVPLPGDPGVASNASIAAIWGVLVVGLLYVIGRRPAESGPGFDSDATYGRFQGRER